MRISKIQIHNYRSIRDLTIHCEPVLILLGANNHGKSNVLSALDFFLSGAKPQSNDLFDFDSRDDHKIWVECDFHELTPQEKTTFKKYLLEEEKIRIRRTVTFEDGKPVSRYQGYCRQASEEWLSSEYAAKIKRIDDAAGTPLHELLKKAGGKPSKARVEELQQQYMDEHHDDLELVVELEDGDLLGQKNVATGVLPEFFLVPAVRDLADETKIKGTALLGRLISRAIQFMEQDGNFGDIKEQLQAQFERLNKKDENNKSTITSIREIEADLESAVSEWGVKIDVEVQAPEIEKVFELGTRVHVHDGLRTPAEQKGHGLQRALIFALLKTWARSVQRQRRADVAAGELKPRASSDSLFFAIEEPELFLHPQAQRELQKSLSTLAQEEGVQVFLCTHSAHFIDMENYRRISIISKPNPEIGTQVRQCAQEFSHGDEKKTFNMLYWINPDRGEMFFASKVVFVEGPTEKVVIPYLAKILGVFHTKVSIIDCGGKSNLSLYIDIAKNFRMPFLVVHDEDTASDAENTKISNAVNGSTGSAWMIPGEFETAAQIPAAGRDLGKPMTALKHFENMNEADIPEEIANLVREIYKIPE